MKTIAVVLTLVAVCCTSRTALGLSATPGREIKASVKITPDDPSTSNVTGTLNFEQIGENQPVTIIGRISGLSPGKHGFHVHEKGDLSGGCTTTGSHFNPYNKHHGAPEDAERHVGDLGNIVVNDEGVAEVRITDSVVSLTGPNSIIGRAIVIHSNIDDLGKQDHPLSSTTGNAGSRVACGVIGTLSPPGNGTASNSCCTRDSSLLLLSSIIVILSVRQSTKIRGEN